MNSLNVKKFAVDILKKKITFVFNNDIQRDCLTICINVLND